MEEYYTSYYNHQIGGGVSSNDQFLQLQIPRVYQRGRGVGAIFSNLWRFLQPILKKGASFASRELIETGADILNGIASQKPLKTIIADRSIQLVDKVRNNAADKIKKMAGAGSKRKYSTTSKAIKGRTKKKCVHLVGKRQPAKKKVTKNKNKIKRILDIFT